MEKTAAEELVNGLYRALLRRSPQEKEFAYWVGQVCAGLAAEEVIKAFLTCAEYVSKAKPKVETFFENGHYYSPVVNPVEVKEYVKIHREYEPAGVSIDLHSMATFWSRLANIIKSTPFTEEKSNLRRFHYNNTSYPYGDAIILRAMLLHYRPERVVEVGSGFSSACILDSADEGALKPFHLTCIDPDAERLRTLLKDGDVSRVTVIEQPVQAIPLEIFSELRPGDFLFIDSTHVLKTGSDVHYELFSVLPALTNGVILHFHDIHYPFEYPDDWIFSKNYSWNEIYALRAFLMYNSAFSIRFWNACFARHHRKIAEDDFPLFLKNAGGSIWIEKN